MIKPKLLRRLTWFAAILAVFFAQAFVAPPAAAQLTSALNAASAPKFPKNWVNVPALDLESVRGKAVLLYFFEETCPKCRGKWPATMATADKYEDQPILFVAVNSGTPKANVEAYARAVQLKWPIIVDADRSFERECGVGPISLQNIMQFRYVTAEGELKSGNWADLDGTIKQALVGAKWDIQPAEIPSDLRAAWRSIEFFQYAQAAPALKNALSSRNKALTTAARKLSDLVDSRLKAELEAAQAQAESNKWRAYEHYQAIAVRFAGFPAAAGATKSARELGKSQEVRKEIANLKILDKQRELAMSPEPAVRDRAMAKIRKLIDDQPTSEVARLARKLLDEQ